MKRFLSVLLLVSAGLVAAACSNPYTPPGHEGYVYERPRLIGEGGFQGTVTGTLLYFIMYLR
jgi:hypothetical protein